MRTIKTGCIKNGYKFPGTLYLIPCWISALVRQRGGVRETLGESMMLTFSSAQRGGGITASQGRGLCRAAEGTRRS